MTPARARADSVAISVLGTCLATADDGQPIPLTGAQRRLLACLALNAPRASSVERLARALWTGPAPATARASLHNQLSRLRRLLGEEAVRSHPDGYLLGPDVRVDAVALPRMLREVEEQLAAGAARDAFILAGTMIEGWRGAPYADLDHLPQVAQARRSLEAIRYTARTLRLEAAVADERLAWAVAEGERLLAADPHDEHRGVILARALHRQGRRGDALATLAALRQTIRRDLGLDPTEELDRAEAEIIEGGPAPASRRVQPFVGRDEELATLVGHAGGGLLYLDGVPGSGVSTLLRHARRRLGDNGRLAVLVTCPEFPESALATLGYIVEELGAAPVRQGLVEGFRGALEARAAETPVTVLVDDAQHAGPSTLRALVEAAEVPGVGVVLAGHGIGSGEQAARLTLGPLRREAIRDLVRALGAGGDGSAGTVAPSTALPDTGHLEGGRPATEELTARVVALSGGNPLLAGLVLADPALLRDPGTVRDAGSVTAELASVVRHWRRSLGQRANLLLDWVAVIGDPAPRSLVEAMVPHPDDVECPLLHRHASGDLGFHQGAVRLAVYGELPLGRRTEMHHGVALAAAAQGHSATAIAGHLWRARELDPAGAARTAREAATEATLLGAHHDAAAWLHALCTLDPAPQDPLGEIRLRIEYGDALRLCGDPRHLDIALQATSAALSLGEEELMADAGFALLQLGSTSDFGGKDERIREITTEVLNRIRDADRAAPVLGAASLAWSMTAQAEHARDLFERADRAATSPLTRRKVLPFGYLALGHPADLDRREDLAGELTALAHAAEDPVALFEAAHLEVSLGLLRADGARLRAASTQMDALLDRVGDVGRRWSALYTKAAIAHVEEDLGAGEAWAAQAFHVFAPVSPGRALAAYQAHVLAVQLAKDRVGELVPVLADLVAGQPGVPAWHAAYGLALTAAGRAEEATAQVAAALAHAEPDFTWLACHVLGGRAAAATADTGVRTEYYRRLLPYAGLTAWQGTCTYGPVDTTLALLARADGDAALADFHAAAAVQVADRLGAPVFVTDLRRLGLAGT